MFNLNYCVDCRRISSFDEECSFCQSTDIKDLAKNAPANVIGTKLKGRIINVKEGMVDLLYTDEAKNKAVRQYEPEQLRKIL